jgi:hypothetical protein
MRSVARGVVLSIFGTASSFVVSAQQAPPCQLELVSVGGIGRQIAVMGGVHSFAAGGVFARCVGQPTTMRADSVAWYSERDRMDFTNAVEFRDSTMRLNADRATSTRVTSGSRRSEMSGW